MPTIRQQRVAELLFEELSIMIGNELNDPSLSLVRVTNVNVSRDLRNVNVYVTHDDEELSKRDVLQGLRRATPFLRRQIAVRGSLRAVPELSFHYDDTPERAARVDALLRQIAAGRAERGESSGNAGEGSPANPGPATPPTQ
jgi:ribosome-binding factor A